MIYHLAALSVPGACGRGKPTRQATAVNVDGSRRVLQLARRLPGRPRVVFISSRQVYGRGEGKQLLREDDLLLPGNPYGETKLAGERLVEQAVGEGQDAVVLRAFNHTGPRQRPPLIVPQWCQSLAAGERPLQVVNLDTWFDLIDVRDTVRAYRLAALHAPAGAVLNVGGGVVRRSGDLLATLLRLVEPRWPVEQALAGENRQPAADIERLTTLTCWRPKIDLEQTLADTWQGWRRRG